MPTPVIYAPYYEAILRELAGAGACSLDRLISRLEYAGLRVPGRKFVHNRVQHLRDNNLVERRGWKTYGLRATTAEGRAAQGRVRWWRG